MSTFLGSTPTPAPEGLPAHDADYLNASKMLFNNTQPRQGIKPRNEPPGVGERIDHRPEVRVYRDSIETSDGNLLGEIPGLSKADRQEVDAAVGRMRVDIGFTGVQTDIFRSAIAQSQASKDPGEPGRWRQEAESWLESQYGDRAPEMKALAIKLATRDPRMVKILNMHGIGDRRDVLEIFIDAARRERQAGRL